MEAEKVISCDDRVTEHWLLIMRFYDYLFVYLHTSEFTGIYDTILGIPNRSH